MAREKIGFVLHATTTEALALIDEKSMWQVKEGDYVFIEGKNEKVYLGQIVKLERLHSLFKEVFGFGPTALLENSERVIKLLEKIEESRRLERLVATVKPLGTIEGDDIREVSEPPPVGHDAVVYRLSGEDFLTFIKVEEPKLFIGYYRDTNDKFYMPLNKLIEHQAAIAMTRAGKSYYIGVILEELLYLGNVACVVIDVKPEYVYMREKAKPGEFPNDPDLLERWRKIDTSKIKIFYPPSSKKYLPKNILCEDDQEWGIDPAKLSFADYRMLDEALTDAQLRVLYEALDIFSVEGIPDKEKRKKYMEEGYYYNPEIIKDIDDVIDIVEKHSVSPQQDIAKRILLQRLKLLKRLGLFGKSPKPEDVVKKGQISIIAIPGLSEEQRTLFIADVLKSLIRARIEKKIPYFLLFLEEAHLYAPSYGSSPAKTEISTIARLGASQQLGIGLIAITQRPVRLDTDLYSQVGTLTLMRIRNDDDIRSLKQNVEEVASDYIEMLKTFKQGDALIVGKGVRDIPQIIRIRPRVTKHGGETARLA